MISIHVLGKEDQAKAKILWQYLEQELEVSLTSKWLWVATWLDNFGQLVDYSFLVGIYENKPCGIALVVKETQRPLPFPVKAFHIGTNGEPYKDQVRMIGNTIVAQEHLKQQFVEELIKTLTTTHPWEELVFNDYQLEDAEYLVTALNKFKYQTSIQNDPTLFMDLETIRTNNHDVINYFGYNMRHAVRRSLKVLQNDLIVEWAQNSNQASDILEELIILYQQTWQKFGRNGMFSSINFTNFQKAIISKLIDKNGVILFRVKSKKLGTIGCLYLFVDNGVAYGYQIGLNNFSNVVIDGINSKRLKTGYIIHTLCMQECLKRGLKAYNFSTGVYPYKQELTNQQTQVITISVRRNLKPLLRSNIMNLYNKIDAHKRSPQIVKFLRTFIK